jgi:hypothetical protein
VNNELKFGELKKLIELCGEMGVSEINFGNLRVVFGGQTKEKPLTPPTIQTKEVEVQTQQIETEALTEISREVDERDLSLMSIEDPVRFEQMLIEGELEDDGAARSEFGESESTTSERVQATQYQ